MTEPHFAGFWIRLVADCIDSLILDFASFLVELMGLGLIFWMRILFHSHVAQPEGGFFDAFDPFLLQLSFIGVRLVLSLGYFTWGTYRYGTTLGKRIFKIYVVSVGSYAPVTLKQSFIRCMSYALSYIPMGAGFLMVAFQSEKRALHDLIAGTVSILKTSVQEVKTGNQEVSSALPSSIL